MTKFTSYKGTFLTIDTQEAIRKCQVQLKEWDDKYKLEVEGVKAELCSWEGVNTDSGPLGLPAQMSMRPTGREVYARLHHPDMDESQTVHALWSVMVPSGFIPWDRYPVPSNTSHVFHCFGTWGCVGDSLNGEGRGEESWPSMCVASQIDVQRWEGGSTTEREVQTHLHRLGIPCGPIDGIITDRVISAVKVMGLNGLKMQEIRDTLVKLDPNPVKKQKGRKFGHVIIDGIESRVFTSGMVQSQKIKGGHSLSVDGPGRVTVILGD